MMGFSLLQARWYEAGNEANANLKLPGGKNQTFPPPAFFWASDDRRDYVANPNTASVHPC
jgi:hypothetical protein